ncbi:MAG: AprI/Inh family metalloprotease inhibitor [Pseudolabrys sp.]
MARLAVIGFVLLSATSAALAQAPATLGDSAKAMIGTWEFSNADRDKICAVTFKSDPAPVGFKLEFDKNCAVLFPLVSGIVGWNFPENDLLHLLDAQRRPLVEFSEVEDGIYEAPTPGVGVLFLQNPAGAGAPPTPPEQIAGDWAVMHGNGKPLCVLTLATTVAQDGLALTVKPGCDPTIARLNLTLWRIDRDELMLVPARGNPWRFEEVDANSWRRIPESPDAITLVRQ